MVPSEMDRGRRDRKSLHLMDGVGVISGHCRFIQGEPNRIRLSLLHP